MKNFLSIVVFLIAVAASSQNVRFDGFITDQNNNPLEMANVMATNTATKAMDSYAITNDKGRFLLTLKANSNYSLKISYLGMQPKELIIDTKAEDINQIIALEPGGIELDGVEIVKEMPVSISGDTIIYNADSFKTGTERKLGDVLKKLPGVEVNKDGEVEVEGKKVSKLMVEGKDFFDGDTKLGVKNIPADAIDKVQVLRNYNDISALKGVENNEESVAMNIKLKDGKKNFWFGDMEAGIGIGHTEERYNINPKIFYYSPEYSLNVIADFNNIGALPFTMQDYFKFTGGFRSMMRKGGTNFNISSNDLGISTLRNDRAKEIDARFGAANFTYNVNKSWSLSGFAIVSSTLTDTETNTRTDILIPGAENTEFRTSESFQKSELGLFKFSSSYKPTAEFQFDYDALLKISTQSEQSNLFSNVFPTVEQSQSVFEDRSQTPVSLNQNLSIYRTKGDKHVFAFEMQHLYQDEDPLYNPNLGINPFPDSLIPEEAAGNIGILPDDRYDITQEKFARTSKLDAKADYYYMLTPKSNINFTLGNTNSHQNFDSAIFQRLSSGELHTLNPNTRNDVKYDFNDLFFGFHYKFITGKFTFNPGFSVHSYTTSNEQLGSEVSDDFFRVLPDFYALYQIKKSSTLTYNFAMTTDFTDINRFAEGYTFSSYNSLFKGNRFLENALMQVHSLRYFNYNMFNFTNIFANVNYTRRTDAVKSGAYFLGNNQINTAVNIGSNIADETLSGNANYGRSFARFYKASVGFSLNWSKYNNILDFNRQTNLGNIRTTESFSQNYTVRASTNYKTWPNLEVGYNIGINSYNDTRFYTERPFINIDYYFWDAFSFVAEYEFYHYTGGDDTFDVDNEYDFLDASLIYQKKDSKWEYKVSATNLLNTTSLNDDNFNQFRSSTSRYVVQPRYLIFSVRYNL